MTFDVKNQRRTSYDAATPFDCRLGAAAAKAGSYLATPKRHVPVPLKSAVRFVPAGSRVLRALRLVPFDLLRGRRLGRVSLEGGIQYDSRMDLELGRGVWLGRNGIFQGPGRVRIGDGTYVGSNFSFHSALELAIGRRCNFGNFVSLVDNEHGMELGAPMMSQPLVAAAISIGDDVWLGEKVTVLSGVAIGTGAVVAAGAVVRSDVPPGCIVAGVPARFVRERE